MKPGDIITDGIIVGMITGKGTIGPAPAYLVVIGPDQTTAILQEQARLIAEQEHATPAMILQATANLPPLTQLDMFPEMPRSKKSQLVMF